MNNQVNNAGLGEPLVLQSLGLYESIIPNNFFFHGCCYKLLIEVFELCHGLKSQQHKY